MCVPNKQRNKGSHVQVNTLTSVLYTMDHLTVHNMFNTVSCREPD